MLRKNYKIKNTNRFSIILNDEVSEAVRRYAFDKRYALSDVFELAVVEYLVRQGVVEDAEEFYWKEDE